MPRSASTLLQRRLFPALRGFGFYGPEVTHYGRAFRQMLYTDDTLYSPDDFSRAVQGMREGDTVISNELFSGQSAYLNAGNRSRTARRLAAAFPEGEIILILRSQTALLRSLYSMAVYAGDFQMPEDFVQFDAEESDTAGMPTYRHAERAEIYRYSPLIALFEKYFNRVHLFLYEDLRADPEGFIDRFASVTGTEYENHPDFSRKVNSSLSMLQISVLRKLNRWKDAHEATSIGKKVFRAKVRLTERYAGGKRAFTFPEKLDARISRYFAEDNARLAATHPQLTESGLFESHYLP